VDVCQKRLEKIPVILKRFRQSVLAAACSGRLTVDWRIDNGYDGELPAGWRRASLQELLPPGGIFDGPFGSNLKSMDYTEFGVRVIRLENVGHLSFVGDRETFVSQEKYETMKRHTVGEGDIIFASFIAEEIRVCVLPKLTTTAIAKADCFCLRPKGDLVNRRYLSYQLASQESYNQLLDNIHGATRPRINTTQLRKLEVRICSLPEQQEIVHRVEALFALADRLESRYKKAKTHTDKLTQSILARAFRGELVPQDYNDQPASELLKGIAEERKSIECERKPKKRRNETKHRATSKR
jgi:type I restriction enzyme S subunit